MFDELVLLMTIVVGMSLARLVRRRDPGQWGYVAVVGGVLLLSVVALVGEDRFLSIVALSLGSLVVVIPWGLDVLVRACFARERLAWAVRLAGWRMFLKPGAGLSRQQEILHGLAVLERSGVDDALAHFRGLVRDTEDESELRILHEQIVSMLLYGQRWSEGIAHYEARFPVSYAALRPPLALGLLRAYGESSRLDRAAELLRSVEERLGRDPRAAGVVSQARLTFLAYAGETGPVDAALTDEGRQRLGLSAASGALYRGIALARAGQNNAATVCFERVEALAKVRDDRVVRASQEAIAVLPGPVIELEPELGHYAGRVAERLEAFVEAAPTVQRTGPLRITPLLMMVLIGGYLGVLALDGGGPGLLRAGGATSELVRAGSWGRLLTGIVPQIDPIALLLTVYGVWLAGPLVERIHGRGRLLLVSVGAGASGLGVAVVLAHEPGAVFAGPSLVATGVVMAALWILVTARTRLPRSARRVLALPLIMLVAAIAVSIPRSEGLQLPPMGMLVAALVGVLGVALAPPRGLLARGLRGVAGAIAIAIPVAVGLVAFEDAREFARSHRVIRVADGVELLVPRRFAVVAEAGPEDQGPWPLQPGLHDTLAQRVGDRVQLMVIGSAYERSGTSALLRVAPTLAHEFDEVQTPAPRAWRDAYRGIAGEEAEAALHVTTLRRNGVDVGVVIERRLGGGPQVRSVVLLAAPPGALSHAPELYAEVLAEARRTRPSE